MEKKPLIGYTSQHYAIRRNIILHDQLFNYKKVLNFYKLLRGYRHATNYLSKRIWQKKIFDNYDIGFSFNDYNLSPNVDLIHFFNIVNFGKKPWVSTFEYTLPRYSRITKCFIGKNPDLGRLDNANIFKALDVIASDHCKHIIAISGHAYNLQMELIQIRASYYYKEISRKLSVLHPPQPLVVEDFGSKNISFDNDIIFTFIGNDFFCKGGLELVKAFKKAHDEYENIKLIIIGGMHTADKYTKDKDIVLSIIDNNDFIDYKGKLPNCEVLEILKKTHVGLLPSIAETYGYSALEFQAAGCPVISTNIQALAEINNNDVGWVIETPINKFGNSMNLDYVNGKGCILADVDNYIRGIIENSLYNYIISIMSNPQIIEQKANKCINRIKEMHSVIKHGERLADIYKSCLL